MVLTVTLDAAQTGGLEMKVFKAASPSFVVALRNEAGRFLVVAPGEQKSLFLGACGEGDLF